MTKLVIFDLDGVLVDSCDIHYTTLNTALQEVVGDAYVISRSDHETTYNGLSTRTKLSLLGIAPELRDAVFQRKQELTAIEMQNLPVRNDLVSLLQDLHSEGYLLWCASNCIRETVETSLKSMSVFSLLDGTLSNEDVEHPKPSPAIYSRCMQLAGVSPSETLIFEDSYTGLCAAVKSGARVWRVASPSDLTELFVREALQSTRSNLMRSVNIVIPMAGNGSRFANAGYKDPKPFIPVFGSPMISWVVRNLGIDANYIFVIRKEFDETYGATAYLKSLCPGCSVVAIDKVTEGAACTVLLTRDHIDNEQPLVMINSDQFIEFKDGNSAFWFIFDLLYKPNEAKLSGKISTFDGGRHPKWSYAKVNEEGVVTEVREKDPFSDHATTGLYMWRHGSDFVKYAEQMIAKNIRVNNEFYVVPVFNEAIADGKLLGISDCKRMWGIGVPEDLETFLQNYRDETSNLL